MYFYKYEHFDLVLPSILCLATNVDKKKRHIILRKFCLFRL